ncbi:ComEC/Rec2 family competence protein [Micromonospora sp. NPDC050417]|uniref:ComEC/Rec2 family competence protein n=1 Tax=Micromonospora sp. NPDC050417 TaxID=3364280 RepID=UPI003794310A
MKIEEIEAEKAKLAKAHIDAEALRLLKDVVGTARVVPATVGVRADKNFYATFLRSGEGDCIVFKTPGGKVVLVDCGSKRLDAEIGEAHDKFIWDSLNRPRYLFGTDKIHTLVFTHSDIDHYNRLAAVLDDDLTGQKMKVGRVYHTGAAEDYKDAHTWLTGHMGDKKKIYRVVHNLDSKIKGTAISLNGVPVLAAPKDADVGYLDGDGGIRIIDETGPACTVTILAAGVEEDYWKAVHDKKDGDTPGAKNRASIVMLIDVYGKKLLLSGDATRSTELYMISAGTYAAQTRERIRGVDVMHIGHHGSKVTSSSPALLDVVQPKTEAIISAARNGSRGHHLPSWPVVERYVTNLNARSLKANHKGWCWDLTVSRHEVQEMDILAPVYVTGSHGNLDIVWTGP